MARSPRSVNAAHILSVPDAGMPRAQDAYSFLLTELLDGSLNPNDWLSVVEIAGRLKCSRVPVMEALKRLASDGFVTIVPQVGCRVAMPKPAEVHDYFTLFAAVEGCVTRLAAERRTPEDLEEFAQTCASIDRMLKKAGGPSARDPRYRRANYLFHAHIHRIARAPDACEIAGGLWNRSDFYIKAAFGSLYFSKRVRHAHAAIRRALIAGDADAAEAAVEQHLRTVGTEVSRRLAAASPDARQR